MEAAIIQKAEREAKSLKCEKEKKHLRLKLKYAKLERCIIYVISNSHILPL